MKNLLAVLAAFISVSSFAGSTPSSLDSGALYEALNVPAMDISRGEGVGMFQKVVGGIVCVKKQVVYPGARPQYSCMVQSNGLNAAAIYMSLDVPEIDVTRGEGVSTYQKVVSSLSCMKMQVVYPGSQPRFMCNFAVTF